MGISLARKQQELNFLSIGPKKSSSHSVNPIRDRRLLLQMFLRHRAQLFGVIAEISQEVTPLFFPPFGRP